MLPEQWWWEIKTQCNHPHASEIQPLVSASNHSRQAGHEERLLSPGAIPLSEWKNQVHGTQEPDHDIWGLLREAMDRVSSWCRRAQRGTLIPSLSSEHLLRVGLLMPQNSFPVAAGITASAVTRISTQIRLMEGEPQVSGCPVPDVAL